MPLSPRVDPSGEYIAWTYQEQVAIKHVRDPVLQPPTMISIPNGKLYFCDFTERGDLLVNGGSFGANSRLAIYDRRGRLLRTLITPTPDLGVVASWRKYEHR